MIIAKAYAYYKTLVRYEHLADCDALAQAADVWGVPVSALAVFADIQAFHAGDAS